MNATIFLDTVGLLGLWNRRDQWHVAAKDAFAKLLTRGVRFVTTSFVADDLGQTMNSGGHPRRNLLNFTRKLIHILDGAR